MNSNSIDQELSRVEEYYLEYLKSDGAASQVGDVLSDISHSGGKRIRPRLLLLSARCGPLYEDRRDRVCRLAALVEMVHAASLIHDDIVDDSPLRRGKPTIQSKYGKDRAVYAGDLLLSRIVRHLFSDHFEDVGDLFGKAVEDMCIGELIQMHNLFNPGATVKEYYRSIYGKTAALCRLACEAGAIESGCSPSDVEALSAAGENFGYLFQIRDDILDFISDEREQGKPTQSDFRGGIMTLPVLYVLEKGGRGREAVESLLKKASDGTFSDSDEAELCLVVKKNGGLTQAMLDMETYALKALDAIGALQECETGKIFRTMVEALKLSR